MSICFNINCHDCCEKLWVGQNERIYTTIEAISNLEKFLFAHKGHALSFDPDNEFDSFKDFEV